MLTEGWFATGDLMRLATDELYFAGRKKDLIIRGGIDISPLEVETVLLSHPAVREAAVAGAPDPVFGEAVVAAVRLADSADAGTLDDVRRWVSARLADYKVPERLQLAAGYGDRARVFLIIPVSAIVLFAGFFVSALVNVRRPQLHKRLMLLATITLLQAAMGRVFFMHATGGGPGLRPGLGPPPPLAIGFLPSLSLELLIVIGVLWDWRVRGRPHPVWFIGGALLAGEVLMRGTVSATPAWRAFADALAHFSG